MIIYFATADHSKTITQFLKHWAPHLRPHFQVLSYETIQEASAHHSAIKLNVGTYIFSDLERLSKEQKTFADSIAGAVEQAGCRVLNKPQLSLCRYELLRKLYERNINKFNVYWAGEQPERFPVFVRRENDHKGSLTDLIYSQSELDRQLETLRATEPEDSALLIVEYLDVVNGDGFFRKYGCHLIDDHFAPDHVFFSREWSTKLSSNSYTRTNIEEERDFVYHTSSEHEGKIREIFEIAKINYGRMDYGVLDGQIQVWEINTNPMITDHPSGVTAQRRDLKMHVHNLMSTAFLNINDGRKGVLNLSRPTGYSPLFGSFSIS
jgi:hypothetical protein